MARRARSPDRHQHGDLQSERGERRHCARRIIAAIAGKPVGSVGKFAARLDEFKAGDRIRLTLLRQGKKAEAFVTLQLGE